jgi:poly(A) polymerase
MEPKIIPRSGHPISRKNIDPEALKVLYRLYRAGHTAYLVGGGVRDLLLGRRPKDFDVGTSARPAQIKTLFRNCRLIGRRFRLAHVVFGPDKVVEVSTFRREPDLGEGEDEENDTPVEVALRDDNTFGTPEEDALRRDFTVNGLFYDIASFALIDYVGGVEDLRRRLLRTIGEPAARFQEDPVRMIRAVKFAARLGFQIEPETWRALVATAPHILKASPPRVQEEIARLLESGAASRCFHLLADSGLLRHLIPELHEHLLREHEHPEERLSSRILLAVDRLQASGRVFTRPTLYAALLHSATVEVGQSEEQTVDRAVRHTLAPFAQKLGISRRDTERVQQILLAQRRLLPRKGKGLARSLVEKSYFPEAFQLFEVLVQATGEGKAEWEAWNAFLREQKGRERQAGPRRRRRRRRRGGEALAVNQ